MPYDVALIKELAARHNICGEPVLMPDGGMVNEAWTIGDTVLRMVKFDNNPKCHDEAAREAAVVPLAITAGVKCPRMIAWGEADELAPRPFSFYERVEGRLIGYSDLEPAAFESLYVELGANLARLHSVEVPESVRPTLTRQDNFQPVKKAQECVDAGKIAADEFSEIVRWVDLLRARFGEPRSCLIHNDIHSWNVMYSESDFSLAAIIDWGDADVADPAGDFSVMPLVCVPPMLRGYESSGGIIDDGFMARCLFIGLDVRLWELQHLPIDRFDRRWWAWPPGGWSEYKSLVEQHFPSLAIWS